MAYLGVQGSVLGSGNDHILGVNLVRHLELKQFGGVLGGEVLVVYVKKDCHRGTKKWIMPIEYRFPLSQSN